MKPAWLKLNEQWRDEYNFGLTIPFIVGALRDWPAQPIGDGTGKDQLRALLASVRDDAPDGVRMRLYSCDRVQDLVLAPVSEIPSYCISFSSSLRAATSLFVERGVIPESDTPFETLIAALWQRYGSDIEAERFSLRDGAFHSFTQSERAFIARALARSENDV